MNTTPLTRRQHAIYDYLKECQERGCAPSLDEVCQAFDLRSRGSLHKHIRALIDAGLVEPMDRKQRGIRLTTEHGEPELHQLPLLGYIAAGRPIEAVPNPETIEVPAALRTDRPCYVLQVRGESMVEDGILDGDWVIVEQRDQARNGEVVVALVDNEEATLKRIQQRPDGVWLLPANSAMPPMHYPPERVRIQGVVVGQMRRYR